MTASEHPTPGRRNLNPSRGEPNTRIKICGIHDVESARVAAEAGADFVGFVFVEKSPRYVTPETARRIIGGLPAHVSAVGLVNDLTEAEQFYELAHLANLRRFQLHGQESTQLASALPPFLRLWRALPADAVEDRGLVAAWSQVDNVEALLWDAPTSPDNPLGGGSGIASDWAWLADRLPNARPAILAGGLTPDNVGQAIRTVRPWAVDVSSGVESSRGVKDPGKIRAFCDAVRAADAELQNQ